MDSGPRTAKASGAGRGTELAMLGMAVVLSLGAAEIGLRVLGYRPWTEISVRETPHMFSPDSELGWQTKPGEYLFIDIRENKTTIWPGGFRATAPSRTPRPNPILLLGGSFMQGWAVPDSETCGDRLQEAFPSTEILNLGTAAYGTYQSLLAFERFLRESETPPSLVIYGFAFFHEARNMATYEWVKLLSIARPLVTTLVPYVSFDSAGTLHRNPPAGYPNWPFKRQLASVALAQDAYARLSTRSRSRYATEATKLVINTMADTARASGADFLVAFLSAAGEKKKQNYLKFMASNRIWNTDCTLPEHGSFRYTVSGYNHPNARTNADWAMCLERAIAQIREESRNF